MISKKVTSALVATLLLSHTVLVPLTAVAQEQDGVQQVQETQAQTTDASTDLSSPLPEVEPVVPDTSDSSSEPTEDVSSDTGDTSTPETPVQDESQTQTESSEPAVADDTATAEQNARAGFSLADWYHTILPNGDYVLERYRTSASGGAVEIPGEFNGKQVYIESQGFLPNMDAENTGLCFGGNTKITSISFKVKNGKKVKVHDNPVLKEFTIEGLFCGVQLSKLDVSGLDVSNVTNMSGLFYGCSKLQSLNNVAGLSSWNISNVTDMSHMFAKCTSLTDLSPISGWKFPNVTYVANMFTDCTSLTDLSPISGWKFSSKETRMTSMFFRCTSLKDLSPISQWDVSKVTDMAYMFANCTSLTNLGSISKWDISKVTTMSYMFATCTSLTNLSPISGWKFLKVTNMGNMFEYCYSLTDLNPISQWDVSKVTNMNYTFGNCANLCVVDLSGWHLNANANIKTMFALDNNTLTGFHKKSILIITTDNKLKNYNYLSENIYPLAATFKANGGQFSGGATTKTVAHSYTISSNSESALEAFLTIAKGKAGTPTRSGYVFNKWDWETTPPTRPTSGSLSDYIYKRVTQTYVASWYAWNLQVPNVNFGSLKRVVGEKTYSTPTLTSGKLQVNDDRNHNWTLDAKLSKDLTAGSDKMSGALRYKTGSTEKTFSTSSSINIATGKGTKNLSNDWSATNGMMLKVDTSKHKVGTYTATIEWTLKDAP